MAKAASAVPAIAYRAKALKNLTNQIGVYILADLDNVPIYVGQSTDGIRARVNRHLTSARSDIIGNRQLDVWEVAYVWAFPVSARSEIGPLESRLIHHYDPKSQLVNGTTPVKTKSAGDVPTPSQVVQVLSDDDLKERLDPAQRLPRQANHYARIVDHFLTVKSSKQIARAMDAHFDRLKKYHASLLGKATDDGATED
ncbi:GIY-YIG nuclease family protein [Aurantimonas coralicida]|uniref:GIY-YIG nuclease family protein n=1 Tax=Aurantimonas coralicida TaxID=182270 RepID=UPI000404CA23|nr:GIY-YIG nuclease family protein [Aurantimonas coralicida]